MRKSAQMMVLLTVASLLVGCAKKPAPREVSDMPKPAYEQIMIGVTPDQVISIAGKPPMKGTPATPGNPTASPVSVENWMYGKVMIIFSEGKVSSKTGY